MFKIAEEIREQIPIWKYMENILEKFDFYKKKRYYIELEEWQKKVWIKHRKIGSHAYQFILSINKFDKALGKSTSILHLRKWLPFIIQARAYRNKNKSSDITYQVTVVSSRKKLIKNGDFPTTVISMFLFPMRRNT